MQLLFQSTHEFEQDLAALSEHERGPIIDRINAQCPNFACDRDSFLSLVHQPCKIPLADRCCSSLYIMPAEYHNAIILTLDEDPIFDQFIVTLIRLVPESASIEEFQNVARALYHPDIETSGEDTSHG